MSTSTRRSTGSSTGARRLEGDGGKKKGGLWWLWGAAPGAGSLTAAGTDLLPAADSDIEGQVGEQATSTGVTVQEIVEGQGFWVGSSATDRRYVELGGSVGEDEQPSGDERLAVGDRVGLEGEVRPAPQDPAQTLNLDDASSELVTSQGAYVNATTITKK